jgi:hypothetical protein
METQAPFIDGPPIIAVVSPWVRFGRTFPRGRTTSIDTPATLRTFRPWKVRGCGPGYQA